MRCMGKLSSFSAIFTKGNNFCDFLLVSLADEAFPRGGLYTHKGKNLLL